MATPPPPIPANLFLLREVKSVSQLLILGQSRDPLWPIESWVDATRLWCLGLKKAFEVSVFTLLETSHEAEELRLNY